MTLQTRVAENSASVDGGPREGLACADPGARTPIGASENFSSSSSSFLFLPPLFKTTEGVVVGIQIFAWAPK